MLNILCYTSTSMTGALYIHDGLEGSCTLVTLMFLLFFKPGEARLMLWRWCVSTQVTVGPSHFAKIQKSNKTLITKKCQLGFSKHFLRPTQLQYTIYSFLTPQVHATSYAIFTLASECAVLTLEVQHLTRKVTLEGLNYSTSMLYIAII